VKMFDVSGLQQIVVNSEAKQYESLKKSGC
jgi:hypothetical protein